MISSLVKKQNKDKKFVYDYDPKKINAYFPKPKGPKTYKQKINLKILKPKKLLPKKSNPAAEDHTEFYGWVLGLVELIDAKGIEVAQPICL